MGERGARRRDLLPLAGVAAASAWAGSYLSRQPEHPRPPSSAAVLRSPSYDIDLVDAIRRGIETCGQYVRGKDVLLKPNLVEFDSRTCINTDSRVVAAAVEAFSSLGARSVRIGEGPGHRRDTLALADQAGYFGAIPKFESQFTDLNRDDVVKVQNAVGTTDLYLSATPMRADLVVSMPKMKTHHWTGATLAMKNFFGVVPGGVYGWPKNPLHQLGIEESILGLNRIFGHKSFAIVDGIVAMEGNGPIQGSPKSMGVLVFGSDLVAVDATCCRVMGLDPYKIGYLGDTTLGHRDARFIEQRGETIASVRQDFALIASHRHMRGA